MERFEQIIDRKGTSSEKWDKYGDQDILPMWVADSDFRAPQAIIDALAERVHHGVFGYTGAPASLGQAICHWNQSRYGWRFSAESIVYLPGLVCGLNLAVRALTEAGQTVLTPTPVYPPFFSAPLNAGRKLQRVAMCQEAQRWTLDLDDLAEQAAAHRGSLLLLCNPHNPGGTVYRRHELERILAIAIEFDLTICSDEIHCDLLLEHAPAHIPLASLPGAAERVVTLMAPSKTFNIAGLGCSYAIAANDELKQKLRRAMRGIVPSVNLFGYAAAEAALTQCDEWLVQQRAYLSANYRQLLDWVERQPELQMVPMEATYLGWIDARGLNVDNPHRLFEQAGVGLSDGREFGQPGFVRLNFACPRSTLTQALERMEIAIAQR